MLQTGWSQDKHQRKVGLDLGSNLSVSSTLLNPFTAKFKNVIWDYFHIQYYTSVQEAKNRIDQTYFLAYEHGLNISEESEVPAQTPPFKGGV